MAESKNITPERKRLKVQQDIDFNPKSKEFYLTESEKVVGYDYVKKEFEINTNLTDIASLALSCYDENGNFNKSLFDESYKQLYTELSQMSDISPESFKSPPEPFKSPSDLKYPPTHDSQGSVLSFHKTIGTTVLEGNKKKNENKQKITSMQTEFNTQLPELLTKNFIDKYYTQFQKYWEKDPENLTPVANPESCFTTLEIKSKLVFDVLNAKKMCYMWRDKGPMFGISGELSIAGLTIFAMNTLRVICDCDMFKVIKKIKIKNWKNTDDFLKNFQIYFDNAFRNIDSKKGEGENRDNLNSPDCKKLTTLMLNVMDEFKRNYFALKKNIADIDKQYLDFLEESYLLLERLILIKSSLDVSQAEGLTELVKFKSFCLFNSYDYSAVLNTPYCPVLASGKFPGYQEINYIYDDIALFEFFNIIKKHPDDITFLSVDDISKKLYLLFKNNGFINKDFYKNIDVSNRSENSKLFTEIMNTKIEDITIYQHLANLASKKNSKGFDVLKTTYESVSKLFLNYNVNRGVLNFKELTSNSRDIRAHDYANSPIRCFGISVYIKKKINDFLTKLNIQINESLNELEKEAEIKNNLNKLNEQQKADLADFILIDESKTIEGQYKLRTMMDPQTNQTPIQNNQAKYNSFLLGESYDPLEGFIQEIKEIYILMCGQNASEFESSQEIDGLKRVLVFEMYTNKESRVYLNNGPLFRKDSDSASHNVANAKSLYEIDIQFQSYNFPENTIGIVDLCLKRGGLNRIINGILVETTITEADAAHASLGFYTERVHIHKNGELFYNGIKLATVFSGDFIDKYEKQDEMDTNIASFKLLYGLNKFNITANNAIPTINHLISNEVQNTINSYIEQIKNINYHLGKNIETNYNNLIAGIKEFLNSKLQKAGLAKNVNDKCSQLIRTFIQNVNTELDNYIVQNPGQRCNVIHLIDEIGNKLYFILCKDSDKFFMLSQKPEPIRSQREKVKIGGGKDEECQIENNPTESTVNLFSGKYGNYIDVVNGKFVFKEINTEEELKNIENRLGLQRNIKETNVPFTTPEKMNKRPFFTSPRSVEELNLTPSEKRHQDEQEGGKTKKRRRRRVKRKTMRKINKNKKSYKLVRKVNKNKSKITKCLRKKHCIK